MLTDRVGRLNFAARLVLAHVRSWIMVRVLRRFLADQTAATAIEYSLIAAGIALAIVAVVQALGTQVQVPYATVSSALK